MKRTVQYQLLSKDGLKSEFRAMETEGGIRDCITTSVAKDLAYSAEPYTVGELTNYETRSYQLSEVREIFIYKEVL